MMRIRTPEKLIARLRRRKLRIFSAAIVAIILAVLIAVYGYLAFQLLDNLVIDPGSENLEAEKTMLALNGPLMASALSFCFTILIAHGIALGSLLAILILELTSYTKNQLLVEMWDSIKGLQSKIDNIT